MPICSRCQMDVHNLYEIEGVNVCFICRDEGVIKEGKVYVECMNPKCTNMVKDGQGFCSIECHQKYQHYHDTLGEMD